MTASFKQKTYDALRWSEKYMHADMVYLARGGFWLSAGQVFSATFGLFTAIAFANLLSKETYGTYRYLLSLAGSLEVLTLSGMNTAVTQAVASGHEGVLRYAVGVQMRWNLIPFAGAFAGGMYYFVKGNAIFAASLLILGMAFPLTAALNTYAAYLAGKKDFRRGAIYGIFTNAFYTVAIIAVLLRPSKSMLLLVAAYTISNFLPIAYFYWRALKMYKPPGGETSEKKEMLRYGSHVSIVNVFSGLAGQLDKIILFQFLGPAQLAVYSFALAIPDRIKGFTKGLSGIILPKLSGKSIEDIRPVFYKRTLQGALVGAAMSAAYILAAPLVFKTFFPQYLDSVFYSQVFALSLIVIAPASYMASVFHSQKMVGTIYKSSITANVLRIVLFVGLGALWNIWGVITASLAVYAVGFFYNMYLWETASKAPGENSPPQIQSI